MEQKDILQRFELLADVQKTIFKIPFLKDAVNSFLLQPYEDYIISKKLKICFELKERWSFIELSLIHSELAKQILTELEIINNGIKESIRMVSFRNEAGIEFFSRNDGPFKANKNSIWNCFISKI
ncbi:MAG: hypothetical protein H0U95_07935 [Bacteroidetes bacterium]|nr:hypothetical protein [Bacteroidota bacterium]